MRRCGLVTGWGRDLEDMERVSPGQFGGEAKMHCLKRLGERVMARMFKRQVT